MYLSIYLSIYLSVCLSVYGSTALLLDLGRVSVSWFLYSQYDSLDGGSARHKAATYTQDNTNTE
jgi:hypothetical protein